MAYFSKVLRVPYSKFPLQYYIRSLLLINLVIFTRFIDAHFVFFFLVGHVYVGLLETMVDFLLIFEISRVVGFVRNGLRRGISKYCCFSFESFEFSKIVRLIPNNNRCARLTVFERRASFLNSGDAASAFRCLLSTVKAFIKGQI